VRTLFGPLAAGLALIVAPATAAHAQDLADPESDFVQPAPGTMWQADVTETERGHLIGNPDAEVRLTEFISYTCPHCADFARDGEQALDLALVAPGQMALEVRSVIRNWLDTTVSLLVQCGDPAGFKDRHRLFLYTQDEWLGRARNAPQMQLANWARGDAAARLSAARALDLDDTLVNKGMSLPEINACLADDAAAKRLADNTAADKAELGVPGTPSFALDGKLLEKVHSWPALATALRERFATNAAAGGS
jgi:protein-disulfide isomerase